MVFAQTKFTDFATVQRWCVDGLQTFGSIVAIFFIDFLSICVISNFRSRGQTSSRNEIVLWVNKLEYCFGKFGNRLFWTHRTDFWKYSVVTAGVLRFAVVCHTYDSHDSHKCVRCNALCEGAVNWHVAALCN